MIGRLMWWLAPSSVRLAIRRKAIMDCRDVVTRRIALNRVFPSDLSLKICRSEITDLLARPEDHT